MECQKVKGGGLERQLPAKKETIEKRLRKGTCITNDRLSEWKLSSAKRRGFLRQSSGLRGEYKGGKNLYG